ncbi:LysR family transcriptional regulator [Rhizobium lusitanum]|uniref:HTH-type transcriptional regulator TtuA n=1 Tax=Rhizobium lusitanum TaxID=293958 RepID=A0A6L9UF41_9HYPH|nr:LysR family transcriptional regulator [Rhizobium lusitanum]NEI72610.1 LysR family transcriptional regulator [Rhizobium lusitanum]
MHRNEFGDLAAFLAVAEDRSFTRAAARMGTSQSALSYTLRRLEERLGLRLLSRTTRNIALTEAGAKLLATLKPAFDDIRGSLASLDELRETPSGTIRITSSRSAADAILMPVARELMAQYPDLNVELSVDAKLTDIVGEGFDAGIRLGEQVEKDMIAVRISRDMRMAVVGSPAYFQKHPKPKTPHDLTVHNCINLRLPTLGGLYAWEFEKKGRPLNVRVQGQFTCNDVLTIIDVARNGLGLACLPDDTVRVELENGRLVRVLEDWCPPFPGYHLYYPSRRQNSPAFNLLIEALRGRAYPPPPDQHSPKGVL